MDETTQPVEASVHTPGQAPQSAKEILPDSSDLTLLTGLPRVRGKKRGTDQLWQKLQGLTEDGSKPSSSHQTQP